jgi:transposase
MRFVAVKSVEQQDMLTLHRVREGLMKERVALINRIRGSLSEYGIVIPKERVQSAARAALDFGRCRKRAHDNGSASIQRTVRGFGRA